MDEKNTIKNVKMVMQGQKNGKTSEEKTKKQIWDEKKISTTNELKREEEKKKIKDIQ